MDQGGAAGQSPSRRNILGKYGKRESCELSERTMSGPGSSKIWF